ncbi:uncharacterized protein LOC143596329 isoform X2 [Bidens hawaiensis]|uniref:uncharacterized protein LOC143596329 isoform X2 n=1 Tax=Bidens hawaiensis TaxID=980011 RepID=UPI004048FF52
MDIYPHSGFAATDNINDHHGFCKNTIKSPHGVLNLLSVDELSVDVTKFLNIQDTTEEDSSSSTPPLKKCKTVSHQDVIISELSAHSDNIKSSDPSGFSSISMPARLKPASAMKGSREKRGATPPVKLTVKWAPGVYDPIPTSVSHVVTNNRSSSKHSRKSSKNKQKHASKSSRGSKSKDKRQVRKRGGNFSSSGVSYKFEHEEEFVDYHENEQQPGGNNFRVGNSEQLCGSSFMKRYGTSLHLSSVAEAT